VDVQVGPATITIHFDDQVVVCEPDSKMSSTADQGFFARDTRMVSGYRLKLGRVAPVLLNSSEVAYYSSRFVFTNPELETTDGTIAAGTLELILDRSVAGGVHEDYDLTNHSKTPVTVILEVSLESDFADLFDVKSRRRVRRGKLQATWAPTGPKSIEVETTQQGQGVQRSHSAGTRTKVRSMSATVAAPARRMVRSMSWRRRAITRSTPGRPAAARP
jgi:glycogen debranching enzyme